MLNVTEYVFNGTDTVKLGIKDVIYNPPATIVLWEDGTKTVSKCDKEDKFDKLTGFSLCVAKHYAGNNHMREWMEKWVYNTPDTGSVYKQKYEKKLDERKETFDELLKEANDTIEKLVKLMLS